MSRTLHLFGTDWCAMMVPIQVIRWYRMQCYDGTDSCATVVPNRRYCHRLPKSICVIGDNVFYGCDKLKNVVIPDGLKKIGILQERTKTMVKYKDVDYTITQLVNLIYKET